MDSVRLPLPHLLYRFWCLARRPIIKTWEKSVALSCDYAKSGSSALLAGTTRALSAELAHAFGEHSCAVLWDFEKFFDSISPVLLIQRACSLGYPMLDLLLGLHIHLSPRILQSSGVCASPLLIKSSILQGCAQSVPFARALLRDDMCEVVQTNPIDHTLFVDDVGAISISPSPWRAASQLVASCLSFSHLARKLALTFSTKSLLLTSSNSMDRRLSKLVAQHNLPLSVTSGGRDLGLWLSLRGRRILTLQGKRCAEGQRRLLRIKGLSTYTRKARALITCNALPSAL